MILNYVKSRYFHVLQLSGFLFQYFKSYNSVKLIPQNLGILRITQSFSTVGFNEKVCWKCGAERKIAELFCDKCHVIQNPSEKENYFKLFQIEEQFSIDEKLLRDKFRKIQSVIHPDKFSNTTHEEQTISEEYSSLINKAHSNLQSPLKRAEHLLQLKGQTISEGQTVDNPEFLLEVMSLNEEVEEAEGDINKMKELNEKSKMRIENILQRIDDCFKNNDIETAKNNIITLKYYCSISNRINGSLRELGVSE
nr:iron-sulfur cluster co-chaperone protein HscB, mitochondrial [Leptinotarsa decemlineata]